MHIEEQTELLKGLFLDHLKQHLDLGLHTGTELDLETVMIAHQIEDCPKAVFSYLKETLPDVKGLALRRTHYDGGQFADQLAGDLAKDYGEGAGDHLNRLYEEVNSYILEFRNLLTEFLFNFLVIDCETTGLNGWLWKEGRFGQEKNLVLEIAAQLVDENFEPKADPITLVIHHPASELNERMDDYVRNMHTKTGLLEKVETSTLSVDEATEKLLAYLVENSVPRNNMRLNRYTVLAGNSVSFDVSFLNYWHGKFTNMFSHQLLDVSAFQLMNKATGFPIKTLVKKYDHSALSDIQETIAEGRCYVEAFKSLLKESHPNFDENK